MQMRWPVLLLVLATAACDGGKKPTAGSAAPSTVAKLDLPKVTRSPALVAATGAVRVNATRSAIEIDGKTIVDLQAGAVKASAKENGAAGMNIVALGSALATLGKDTPLVVAMDRSLPYRLLVEILFTAKQSFTRFELAATDGTSEVVIPITLPAKALSRGDFVRPVPEPDRGPPTKVTNPEVKVGAKTTLTPDIVLGKVQSVYLTAIKRCYQYALKRDPAATGKVTLSFTVNKAGRISNGRSMGFDTEVDECIDNLMTGWTFPIPKNGDGEPVDAPLQVSLLLVADPPTTPPGEPAATATLLVDPDKAPLGLVVSINEKQIILWSISGFEGTLLQPRRTLPTGDPTSIAKLHEALAEIVKRRWGGKERLPETHSIILQADNATTLQTIAELLVAMRTTGDGATKLFPDVALSVGFE